MLAVGKDLPVVGVRYENVCVKRADAAAGDEGGSFGILGYLASFATAPVRGCRKGADFALLDGVSGRLRPGSATLILAPPGAGSTTLLRLLSGRTECTSGSVTYNGRSPAELKKAAGGKGISDGVEIRKLAAYCPAEDEHEFLLTVKETLAFAYEAAVLPPGKAAADTTTDAGAVGSWTPPTADDMLRVMDLEDCQHTKIGNSLIRGVSGGQKRRVTVGESLIQNARILALDSPTSGLDSVTAARVMRYCVDWAHQTQGVLVTTLQQPGPETYNMFDEVILLGDGRVLYHGPTAQLEAYFASLGYIRPSFLDIAGWAVEIVSSPIDAAQMSLEDRATLASVNPAAVSGLPAPVVPQLLTVDALADHWQASPQAKALMADDVTPSAGSTAGVSLTSEYAKRQYGSLYATSIGQQLAHCTARELKLIKRNWLYAGARFANAIGMGAILGSVFIFLKPKEHPSDVGLIVAATLFALTFVAFLNNAITPIAFASRQVAYKHLSSGLFSPFSYNFAVLAGHFPISVLVNASFTIPLYFLVGYDYTGDRWAFFTFIVLLMDLAISTVYRSAAYSIKSQETAMIASSVFIGVGMATGGYFVLRDSVPEWIRWCLYISPFFWSTQSLVSSEFDADKYRVQLPDGRWLSDVYMDSFTFLKGLDYRWAGAGVLIAYYVIFGLVIQPLLLKFVRYDSAPGTQRGPKGFDPEDLDDLKTAAAAAGAKYEAPAPAEALAEGSVAVPMPRAPSSAAAGNTARFVPVTLAFKDVCYSVPIKGQPHPKQLLHNVSGFAKPGTITALCGASGAGKTTLLDVLGFRKTTGTVSGTIRLNGQDATPTMVARAGAFAEQFDAHLPTATVYEALRFSVQLRTEPSQLGPGGIEGVVQDTLETLELTRLADRLVSSLSPGELKRLSLGVEVCSMSGLVFCDEPTTGLSARAAAVVVRCLQRIAFKGCTVVCTIHQPSAHLFFAFSHLLLLAPGGYQVYFGPLGHHAATMVRYFTSVGAPALPLHTNPATYMLEVLHLQRKAAAAAVDVPEAAAKTPSLLGDVSDAASVDATSPSTSVDGLTGAATPISASAGGADGDGEEMSPKQWAAVFAQSPAGAAERKELLTLLEPGTLVAVPATALSHADYEAYKAQHAGAHEHSLEHLHTLMVPMQPLAFSSAYARSWPVQALVVLQRALLDSWRNTDYNGSRLVAITFLGLFFGLIYIDVDFTSFAGVQSALGAVLASCGFPGVIVFTISVPLYIRYREFIYRERDAHFYGISAQTLALLVTEMLWVAAFCVVFSAIFYYLIGFKEVPDTHRFLPGQDWGFYTLGLYLSVVQFELAALAFAAMFPSTIIAQLAGGVFLSQMDFGYYVVRALATNQFHCEGLDCPTVTLLTEAGPSTVYTSDYVAHSLDTNFGERWQNLGYAVVILTLFIAAIFVIWRRFNHQKR